MKSLLNTFVIVDKYNSPYNYFLEFDQVVSFNKKKLDARCEQLNKEYNDDLRKRFEKANEKRKKKLEFIENNKFFVLNMYEAIEAFKDEVYDSAVVHDESY